MNVLLVEPKFPIPPKSRNHKNFLPIGLLKIGSYLRKSGIQVKLIRGIPSNILERQTIESFNPDEIWVTSLFTYWANYVKEAVRYYQSIFPHAKVIVGGIYASLFPEKEIMDYTGCDKVWQGVISESEDCAPAYDLIDGANPHPIDYQIIHASRGCERQCSFCGTWRIEPLFISKRSIKDQIDYRKVIFYDNNFLMNPYVENILQELIELKAANKLIWCESQSGFDGRILLAKPHLASMIKASSFRYPRIAWDWRYDRHVEIKEQINLLTSVGYNSKDIFVFMLYNWETPFEEMELKRVKCFDWQVQIADCRYRPLTQLYDNYDARKFGQSLNDYYINDEAGWTDILVKQFRKNVREQNICVRHGFSFYSRGFEQKTLSKAIIMENKALTAMENKIAHLGSIGVDSWLPCRIRYPSAKTLESSKR